MLSVLLLFLGSSLTASAQFNPANPADPQMYYRLTTSADPVGYGWTSGSGRYKEGQSVYVNTSASNSNYKFEYWTLDGDVVSTSSGFYYTMRAASTELVAHYSFQPSNPADPTTILKNRLYLKSEPEGCCSFNRTSGEKYLVDNYIYVNAYANQGYEFKGWYEGQTLVSSSIGFNYLMQGDENVTLTAKFEYNPSNPDDPSSQGGHIQTKKEGDLNGDNEIDVSDVVLLIGHYVNGTTSSLDSSAADVNKDGVIDIADVVSAVNIYLNNK